MSANLENLAVATELEKVSFHSSPKERQCKRMFKLLHKSTHLTCQQSNVQILQVRLQQYINEELPDVQAQKRQRNQRSNCQHLLDHRKSKRIPEKHLLIDYAKAFDCMHHNKLWKSFKEIGIPDHLTCLLRNLLQVKKQQLELDMKQQTDSKQEKEYIKAIYCHPAYITTH